jgi:hypothetical protein
MTNIADTNIKFSVLRQRWSESGFLKVDGTNGTDPGSTNISLSEFRGALFTDGENVPNSGQISINTHFKNNVFGSSNNNFVTANFNFNDDFSGESDRLYPVSSASSTTAKTTSEHKFARLFHSNVTYAYPSILLCPQVGDPTIETEDDAEVWIKMKLNTPFHFQIGIIHKHQSSWANLVTNALRVRHATYNDRITLHTFGYIIHAGHDIESSTKVDELTGGTITNETTTSNYHNRIGTTAGSGNGFATVSSTYNYLQGDFDFYQSKTSISDDYYIGMKVNYYEITLTGDVVYQDATISNIRLNGSQLTASDNVYTGMYLSSSEGNFPASTIIQSITYSSSTSLEMGDEITGTGSKQYGPENTNITFKAFGQRLEFQYTDDSFTQPKNIGPNHIILPRKYRTSSSGSNLDIDSWAFFVGDSTGGSNSATFTIKDSNPINLYSITYNFSGQTAVTNTSDWSPGASTEMSDWVNGTSVVNGTYWTGTKTVKGWNLSNETDGTATSSSSTGPNSGYNGSTGFMYTEVSSSRHLYTFVCRTPAFNFSTLMGDTLNDLKFKFRVHAYGSQIGDLYINISTSSTTTYSSSTNLASYESFSGFTGYTSAWQEKEIDLNSYRNVNSDHYIYFSSYNATGYFGDLSVDYVQILEEATTNLSITYDFSGQIAVTNTSDWSPGASTEMSDWVNGTSVVNGTYWTGTKTVKGWNLSNETDGTATSSSSTGPNSGYNGSSGFMYTEVSSSRHLYTFVCRTPAFNFSTLMRNTSNDLKLKFRVHAYGSQIGDLYINISTSSTTTYSGSTNLASYESFSGFTGYTSAWQEKEIDLNSYRNVNSDHYIYFSSYNATGYFGDLSVDYVQILEEA